MNTFNGKCPRCDGYQSQAPRPDPDAVPPPREQPPRRDERTTTTARRTPAPAKAPVKKPTIPPPDGRGTAPVAPTIPDGTSPWTGFTPPPPPAQATTTKDEPRLSPADGIAAELAAIRDAHAALAPLGRSARLRACEYLVNRYLSDTPDARSEA
jgi:hypothetical protein